MVDEELRIMYVYTSIEGKKPKILTVIFAMGIFSARRTHAHASRGQISGVCGRDELMPDPW